MKNITFTRLCPTFSNVAFFLTSITQVSTTFKGTPPSIHKIALPQDLPSSYHQPFNLVMNDTKAPCD